MVPWFPLCRQLGRGGSLGGSPPWSSALCPAQSSVHGTEVLGSYAQRRQALLRVQIGGVRLSYWRRPDAQAELSIQIRRFSISSNCAGATRWAGERRSGWRRCAGWVSGRRGWRCTETEQQTGRATREDGGRNCGLTFENFRGENAKEPTEATYVRSH